MGISIYNLKKWIRMLSNKSVEHVNQGEGKIYSLSKVKGYYNDLTEKVTKQKNDSNIPVFKTERGNEIFFPIEIFQYGLGAYDLFLLEKENTMLKKFKACVDWAVINQQVDGAWSCFFFDSPDAPYSAMAQGEGASLLVRAYLAFNDCKYLSAATKATEYMQIPIEKGGTTKYVGDEVYLKEFTHKPTVLNGWIFSLFGLYDYLKVKTDEKTKDIYTRSIQTIAKHLVDFDNGYWSKYNRESMLASPFYHHLHIAQLKVLYDITGEEIFNDYSRKWHDYSNKSFNRVKAFIIKAIQKLLEKKQTESAFVDRTIKVMQIMPEFRLAGAEIMAENLSVSLFESNFPMCVASLYDDRSAITDRLTKKNIPVFYLRKKRGWDLRVVYRLFKLFKKEKPYVVHTHRYVLPYVVPAAIFAKVPVRVHTIHNVANKEVGKLQRVLNRFFYKHCRVVPVSISPRIKQTVMEEYRLLDDQAPMVYNGIDLTKCIGKENYNVYTNGKITILHIGRFSEQKNHTGLVESFKIIHDENPEVTLKLIGGGGLEQEIKEKVKELGLWDCVEFLGIKSDVYPYLYNADIFVLPSLWEGMPITLIEAMATGLPIVATNVGGVPDMIQNDVSGLLVDTSKVQIAQAIMKLTKDSNLRQQLGSAAKVASKQFSAQEMARKYSLIYMKKTKK